jgi:hypothetical protein
MNATRSFVRASLGLFQSAEHVIEHVSVTLIAAITGSAIDIFSAGTSLQFSHKMTINPDGQNGRQHGVHSWPSWYLGGAAPAYIGHGSHPPSLPVSP